MTGQPLYSRKPMGRLCVGCDHSTFQFTELGKYGATFPICDVCAERSILLENDIRDAMREVFR